MHKEKPLADERVEQGMNRLGAKNFASAVIALLILLTVKAVCALCGMSRLVMLPELLALLAGGAAAAILRTVKGLWGDKDERMLAEDARYMSIAWTILHCVALLSSVVLLLADRIPGVLCILTMLALTLIQYVFLGRMTHEGLLLRGKRGFNWPRLAVLTAAVLVFGLVMLWGMSRMTGRELPLWAWVLVEAVLLFSCMLGGMLAWGLTKRSERNADAQVAAMEESDEE